MDMYVKDAVTITNATDLRAKLDSLQIYEQTKTVDGDMSDWTDEELTNPVVIPATDGREITVYATLADDGLYLFYDAIHNSYVSNLANWWENSNIEFRLPDGKQRFASANGQTPRWTFDATATITDFKFVTVTENGKHHTKVEVFISYSMIENFDRDATSINAGFAWKTGGETGSAWAGGDFWYVPEADPGMRNIIVTRNGIKTATLRTIDGDAVDWANSTFSDFGCGNGQYSAFLGVDGLYAFYKLSAPSIAVSNANVEGNWWQNVNLEFFGNANTHGARIMLFNGKLYHTGYVTDAAMKYTHTDDGDTLYIEFFVANEHLININSESESVTVDIGGQFHPNGWRDFMRNFTINRA